MVQAVIPQMRERRSGTIVNVTSRVTLAAMPLAAAYTASKQVIEGFTGLLALTCHCEFPPEWIRVRPIKGRTHEEAAIYGRADYCGVEGAGGWREGGRPLPQAWNFRSNVLQLESQIRRHGGL
jgi:hypothetical protein